MTPECVGWGGVGWVGCGRLGYDTMIPGITSEGVLFLVLVCGGGGDGGGNDIDGDYDDDDGGVDDIRTVTRFPKT